MENNNLNRILQRQIKRHFGSIEHAPAGISGFISDVNDTYKSLQDDALIYQNSLDISSQELREAYMLQKNTSDQQNDLILKIKKAIATLDPTVDTTESEPENQETAGMLQSLIHLIEEHKQFELSLKESEHYLREILDSQEVGVMIIDAETHEILFINQKGSSLYGASKEEIIGNICHQFTCPTKCDECSIAKYKCGFKSTEKLFLNSKGETIPILKSVVHSTFNNRRCYVESFVDITARKQVEEELMRANEAAQAASRSKSEFLASMSHEIRTPLNGVIGFTDLLMKTRLSDTQLQYLSTISLSANSLLDIINDILDFSKIEAGKLDLEIRQHSLFDISNQVADMIKYQAHQKGLELLLNITPETPQFIWVDALRLRQVLVNLLGNAVKFTNSGEIEFKIEYLGLNVDGTSGFRFAIRDSGVGILPENQKKIFEAFSQEDSSTTRKYGGTGLGLTISNKLLHLMGSKLQLESTPGMGSTFFFDISFKSAVNEVQPDNNLSHIKHVLIADDNDHNRYIISEILAFKNISVTQAESGTIAIEMIKSGLTFDAILMDYHMPVMDGIETIRQIRLLENFDQNNSPMILLYSSSDDEIVKAACTELQINHRLVKPIKMQQLYEALAQFGKGIMPGETPVQLSDGPRLVKTITRALTIMIVEDNAINLFLIQTILMEIMPNATLVEARNGSMAVEQFTKVKPDMIIMDVQMPVMNGYEATEAIRALETDKRIPIIALTAGTVKGEREKCLAAGMDDYLTKPVVHDTVLNTVNKWLGVEMLSETGKPENMIAPELHINEKNLVKHIGTDAGFRQKIIMMAKMNLFAGSKELKDAVATEDISEINRVAHKLKGTALSVCFDLLSGKLNELELLEEYSQQTVNELTNTILDEIEYLNTIVLDVRLQTVE